MSTEFFLLGDEHTPENEFGVRIGGYSPETPNWPAFSWCKHPEEILCQMHVAGGAQDAWGKVYDLPAFEKMLRDCRVQTQHRQPTTAEHEAVLRAIFSR